MSSEVAFNVIDCDEEAVKLRILTIRSKLFSGNNAQMAERLKITPSELSHTISGRRGIGFKIIKLIAENLPDVDVNWLISGRGGMLMEDRNTMMVSESESDYANGKMSVVEDELKKAHEQIDILINSLKLLQDRWEGQKQG